MKWYYWLAIIIAVFIIWYVYTLNKKAQEYKASKINGQKCILSTDGNGVWLNGKCVSNTEYAVSQQPGLAIN